MIRTKEVLRSAPREGQQRHAPDGAGSASELDYRDGTALQKSCWLTDDVTAGHACSLPCPPPPCRPYVCGTYAQTPTCGLSHAAPHSHRRHPTDTRCLPQASPPSDRPAAGRSDRVLPDRVRRSGCPPRGHAGVTWCSQRQAAEPAAGSSRKSDHPVDCGSLSKMREQQGPMFSFCFTSSIENSIPRSPPDHRRCAGAPSAQALAAARASLLAWLRAGLVAIALTDSAAQQSIARVQRCVYAS